MKDTRLRKCRIGVNSGRTMLGVGLAFMAVFVLFSVVGSAAPPVLSNGTIWGIQAQPDSNIISIDAVTGTPGFSFPIPASTSGFGNGRGLAYDPLDNTLLYTAVNFPAFTGDGLIHKVATTGGSDITTISLPSGVQADIGALAWDWTSSGSIVWAAGYNPVSGNSVFYHLDISINPAGLLGTCSVPFTTGTGVGDDTLAVLNHSTLLSDTGDIGVVETYKVIDIPSCTITSTIPQPVSLGISGIQYLPSFNVLIGSDETTNVYNFGPSPFSATSSSAPFPNTEGITWQPPQGSISGTKFNDLNHNGANDAEPGLGGWTITLADSSGTPITTTTTAGDGSYSFKNLVDGTYIVGEVLQSGWIQTAPAVSTTGSATYTVVITGGSHETGKDFGNYQLGIVSGQKFNDVNGNGIKDPGDTGLASWTISLTGTDTITNTPVSMTATTDANGNYNFSGLTAGTYIINETLKSGWIQTAPGVSTTGSATYTVTIGDSGTVITGKDFGNFQLGSVSGTKFEDLNANGIRDAGEVGLAGWNITINGTDTITGTTVNQTTTTDANGNYNFAGLTAGTYTISETMQSGWVQTAPATGTYTVTITSGAAIAGQDFGNFHKGDITGGGWINVTGDPKATFGIVGHYPGSGDTAQGNVQYQDHNASLNIKSINITAVSTTLDKTKGVITGFATVNGAGSYPFVVYVVDNTEPGVGADVFRISLPTYPYSNGAILSGGNIQIHS